MTWNGSLDVIAMHAPVDYARARRVLMRRDPVLAAIIRSRGPCGLEAAPMRDPFTALVRAITFQQLSVAAAGTIYGRLVGLMPNGGDPTPDAVRRLSDETLRAVGYSRQKLSYLRDLCEKAAAAVVPFDRLAAMADEEVIQNLTRIRGIGRWSAEMFLIFTLKRPDVFPVDDLGIVNAIRRAYGLRKAPAPERLRRIAEPWRPYRSIACWYLWRSLEALPQPADRAAAATWAASARAAARPPTSI